MKLRDIFPPPELAAIRCIVASQSASGEWTFRADADCPSSVTGVPPIHVEATGVVSLEAAKPLIGLALAAVLPAIASKLYAPDDEV